MARAALPSVPVRPGRVIPDLRVLSDVWQFSGNKTAAKEPIAYLMQADNVPARCDAVAEYDIPPFDSMLDLKLWEDVEPSRGTVYNYPSGRSTRRRRIVRRPRCRRILRSRFAIAVRCRHCWQSRRASSRWIG